MHMKETVLLAGAHASPAVGSHVIDGKCFICNIFTDLNSWQVVFCSCVFCLSKVGFISCYYNRQALQLPYTVNENIHRRLKKLRSCECFDRHYLRGLPYQIQCYKISNTNALLGWWYVNLGQNVWELLPDPCLTCFTKNYSCFQDKWGSTLYY